MQGPEGKPGPAGKPGEKGPAGETGPKGNYTFYQSVAQAVT